MNAPLLAARRLTVRHVTTYRYAEPVSFGEHHMMFRPRESHDLRLLGTKIEITPQPAAQRWLHDVFDNSVLIATFDEMAALLRFSTVVALEHLEIKRPEYMIQPHARTHPFAYSEDELPNLGEALRRHHPGDEIASWARQFLDPSGSADTMDLLRRITAGIRTEFAYERRTAKGVWTPQQTLERRRGACRDFALLMMEGVRALGLAARFVSGYVFLAADGLTTGGSATHAWMQVYLPGAGWVDFDPTNSIVGNRNLIRVAVAWDPAQALPLWGSFTGYASSFQGMDVDVNVTEGHE